MKNKIYLLFFAFSVILLPILFVLFYIWMQDSNYYYINNFMEHKAQFVEAAELKLNESNENKDQIIQKELFDTCRVDSIDLYNFSGEKVYISFSMYDSSFYPSTEYEYRMIIYQPNNELPEFLDKYYNRRISKNWFYVTNSHKSLHNFFLMLALVLFILSVWIIGIIHILKKSHFRKK